MLRPPRSRQKSISTATGYEADPTETTDTMVDCGGLGYSGEVESANGYISVVTPEGESNKLPCTFAV